MKDATLLATTSAAADVTTQPFDLIDLTSYSVQVVFTGVDVVGSLKLQSSLDNVTYTDVAGSTQAVAASESHTWNVPETGDRYIRVFWDYTSGTGNITIKIFVKEPIVR